MTDETNNHDKQEPAFPRSYVADGHNGMTLRDWFAGQIIVGLIAHAASGALKPQPDANGDIGPALASGAYGVADAMLAERKK